MDSTAQYWDDVAPKWDAQLADGGTWQNHQEQFRRFHWFMKRAVKIGNRTKSYRLLDLGCGTGEAAWPLWRRVQSVTFFDKSTAMLRLARNKYPKGIFVRGDATIMPFMNDEFDVIVSRGGLLSQLRTDGGQDMLTEAWRVLRPQGYLLLDFSTFKGFIANGDGNSLDFKTGYKRPDIEAVIHELLPTATIMAYDGTEAHTFNRILLKKTV